MRDRDRAYLECKESTLHAHIGTDVLIYGPSKFTVEFPSNECQHKREESDKDGNREQIRLNGGPNFGSWLDVVTTIQVDDSVVDLIVLNGSVDEHSTVVHTQSNNLNSVFEAQRIPDQYKLVEETKDEECEVGWDGFRALTSLGVVLMLWYET